MQRMNCSNEARPDVAAGRRRLSCSRRKAFKIADLLVILALTGIYLWFKIHTERVIGSILLAVSLGFSLTLIMLIRTA